MIVVWSRKFSAGAGSPPGSPIIWLRTSSIVGFANGDDIFGRPWDSEGSNTVAWGGNNADGSSFNPTYNTAVTANSIASVEFTAANTQLISTNGDFTTSGYTAATIYCVAQIKNDPPATSAKSGLWLTGNGYDHASHIPFTDGTIYDCTFSTVRKTVGNPGPSLASPFYYGVKSTANSWEARLNGSSLHSTGTNTFDDGGDLLFGRNDVPPGDGGGSIWFDGYLWELILYNSVLDSTDTAALESYFASTYGI